MSTVESADHPATALQTAAEEFVSLLSDIDEDDPSIGIDILEELWEIAAAIEDLLETVDLAALLETVDLSELPSTLELEDLPEAIAETDPSLAADLSAIISLVDMGQLWDTVNAREFWRQSREVTDEIDDVTGEDLNDHVPGDPFEDDDDEDEESLDVDVSTDPDEYDPETLENAVQTGISQAVGEFREGILDARARLKKKLEANRERSQELSSGSPDSRNPTAVSTMAPARSNAALARYSTVPEETKYSTAPNRERVYGDRFEEATDE